MKKQLFLVSLLASFAFVGCGGSSNSGEQNTDSLKVEEVAENIQTPQEEEKVEEIVFTEDVAKQVFDILKPKGYKFPSQRNKEDYGSLTIDNDNECLNIYCFKKNDGNILAYVYRFSECEGTREIASKNFYLMADGKLTKTTQGIPFAKLKLDDFTDELGKLDFMMHSEFVEDHQKVWNDFSNRIAKEYEIEYINPNKVSVTPVYYYLYEGTYPMIYNWNGDEFVKSENQNLPYAKGNGFAAIRQGWPFPDLSKLKHYKATAKGDSMILKFEGNTIATFEIKDNHVKDFVVYSPKYVAEGESLPYKVTGKDRTYAKHTFAPKKISVAEYLDLDTWTQTTTTYTLTYDNQNRVKTINKNNNPMYEISYELNSNSGQILVDRFDGDEFSEGGEPIRDVYTIENGKFTSYQHGECDAVGVKVRDGFFVGYDGEDAYDAAKYFWFDGSWNNVSCQMENWDCFYEYSHTSLDWYQDKMVINILPIITEGTIIIDASTFFFEGPVICRSEYLPHKVIFDGSNIQYILSIGGSVDENGAYRIINTSDSKNNDRRFNRRISFEY